MRGPLVRSVARTVSAALAGERRAFSRALEAPGAAQDAALRRIVKSLAETRYGRAHGLRADDRYPAFRDKLPVVGYDDLDPWVKRQMDDGSPELVAGSVLAYETTSGSAGPVKYVPYSTSLRQAFDHMFRVWLADLLASGPRLFSGRVWISVSPRFDPPSRTSHRVPIGLASDFEYLAPFWRWLLRPFLVLPPTLAHVRDPADLKRVLAGHLVAGRPEVVSVWSPSFLTVLLEWITDHRDVVLADWRAGVVRTEDRVFPLAPSEPAVVRALAHDPIDWREILPDLRLVSCWADGPAAAAAAHLRHRLPWVTLQPKGLVATEAPVTVPLADPGLCVPLVQDVLVELLDDRGRIHRIDEAEPDVEYAVIVTAPGGFARYRLGDRVRAGVRVGATPSLSFVGRESEVSDLVGEKLAEPLVRRALDALPLGGPGFRTLVPVRERDGRGRYVLVVDRLPPARDEIAPRLEALLQEAHRYREARRLEQLGPVTLAVVPAAEDRLLDTLAARGMRRGAIKPTSLVRDPVLGAELLGHAREASPVWPTPAARSQV